MSRPYEPGAGVHSWHEQFHCRRLSFPPADAESSITCHCPPCLRRSIASPHFNVEAFGCGDWIGRLSSRSNGSSLANALVVHAAHGAWPPTRCQTMLAVFAWMSDGCHCLELSGIPSYHRPIPCPLTTSPESLLPRADAGDTILGVVSRSVPRFPLSQLLYDMSHESRFERLPNVSSMEAVA